MGEDRDNNQQPEQRWDPEPASNRWIVRLVILGVVAAAAVAFIFQNTRNVEVSFLFLAGEAPLYVVIVISMVLGALLALIGVGLRRRAKRRKRHDEN